MNRRTFLRRSSVAAALGSLAGCLGSDDGDVPDPVSLSGTAFDYRGGMEVGAHGGPNGQIFYRDEQPEAAASATTASGDGNENLAWFHTLVFGLFPYHFDRLDRGWEAEVVYATDYSVVDWELDADASRPVMPAPTDSDTFAAATELTYVGESDVRGGMGPALHPFSDESEAASFAETHDGTTYEFDDVTRILVASLQDTGGPDGDM